MVVASIEETGLFFKRGMGKRFESSLKERERERERRELISLEFFLSCVCVKQSFKVMYWGMKRGVKKAKGGRKML